MTGLNGRYDAHRGLAAITLLAALDHDDRPSFAIEAPHGDRDGDRDGDGDGPLDLVYCNPALLAVDRLLHRLQVSGAQDAAAFKNWLRGRPGADDSQQRANAHVFAGHLWSAVALEGFKIASGVPTLLLGGSSFQAPAAATLSHHPGQLSTIAGPHGPHSPHHGSAQAYEGSHGPWDYTLDSLPASATSNPHIAYFRSVDWAATPLGPMASWTADLRCIVNVTLSSGFPAVMLWGDEAVMLYNQHYIQLLGALHPCMGKSIRAEAPHHWASFETLVHHINKTGRCLVEGDLQLLIDRHGFSEETHWSFQFVPVLDSNGHIAAYYQSFFETTDYHLLKRRLSNLVEVGSQTANARDFRSFWDIALHTLTLNSKDVPFALLYAADRPNKSDMPAVSAPGSAHAMEKFLLKGAIGATAGHPVAPSVLKFNEATYIFHPYLLQAATSREAIVVHLSDLALSAAMLEGVEWQGYGDPCRIIVVCPILPTNGEQVEGFLIMGTNPRRPFDEDYQQFVQVMLRLFTTSLASVVLFDEEVRRREMAIGQAARIQEQLLAELQLKEKKFQRFAERSDVAIFILDASGKYTYRNQRWFDLFELATGDEDAMSAWQKIAFPDDIKYCEGLFAKLVTNNEPICFELKTRMHWAPPPDMVQPECGVTQHFKWILCSAYPELTASGEVRDIVGNVTDISKQKWAEGIQKIRTDSALESKQHLEHFIDTTSHEMRNPLSAILQCADGILSSSPRDSQPPTRTEWSDFLEQTIDATQTIAQCAQHMRHIVDDILTISKLDSGLLVITPVDAQPESVAKHAVKMFEAEARAASVQLSFIIDQSYRDMDIDWVSLDPTRLLQILINLLTNAIKFTRLETTRKVTVVLAASAVEPKSIPGGIQYNEDRLVSEDRHLADDWKKDPDLFFIQFSISDTGRGLSEEERGSLFTRFSQASPRTHIHYGGSGLGLFISRRLTELQGGAIGLASESKKGSTFSFYIKTRRTKPVLARKGSLPAVFPEDIRHRPETPLISLWRPPAPMKIPTGENNWQTQPLISKSQFYPRQQVSAASPHIPPDANELSPECGLRELKRPESIPEPLHVLVVEDNLVNQRVLAKQLRNLGCVVSVANHGREALDILPKTTLWNHSHPPSSALLRRPSWHLTSTETTTNVDSDPVPMDLSLILMDWEMPIMNGLTAVTKIRELERGGVMRGRVPVIGVTANVRQQQIQTAMAAGMDDVVGKPFRVAELLARMKGLVAGMANGGDTGPADSSSDMRDDFEEG